VTQLAANIYFNCFVCPNLWLAQRMPASFIVNLVACFR
jgi:hypothetical protein